jgi:DNA-binding PadR family transcriptional regulator
MPRHHHHEFEDEIAPMPPIPPIPPHGGGGGGRVRFGEIVDLFANGRGFGGRWGPFHFDFGDEHGFGGGRGGRGGRRHRRRTIESGELRLVLLRLISEEPRHGYDLIRAIEELTGGEYAPSPGIVYPTLTLLQDMGLIEEAPDEGARKPFRATEAGEKYLEEREQEADAIFDRLADLAPEREQSAGPAIGRAVKNLMTALSHRVGRDGLDDDLLHEIAAILDEAAQKIERAK